MNNVLFIRIPNLEPHQHHNVKYAGVTSIDILRLTQIHTVNIHVHKVAKFRTYSRNVSKKRLCSAIPPTSCFPTVYTVKEYKM